MELHQYGLSYGTTYWGTNLCHGGLSTFDQSRCQQPMKHCDGFTPAKLCFEDNRNIALCSSEKQAPFAGTNTPDLYTDLEGKHSPRNGSHCVTLFNGLGKNHKPAPFQNGYVGYSNGLSCNGFHEPEPHEKNLEKTVGHGRPISQSFPKRLPSWGSPVSDNDDRLNHDRTQYTVVPETSRHHTELDMKMERQCFPFRTQNIPKGVDSIDISKLLENNLHLGRPPSFGTDFRSKEGIAVTIPRRWSSECIDKYSSSPPASQLKNSGSLKPKGGNGIRWTSGRSHSEGEANPCLNGWSPLIPYASGSPVEDESKREDLQAKILDMLTLYGAMEPPEIISVVGRGTREEVSQSLCSLRRQGLVNFTVANNPSPTVLTSAGQPVREKRANPGVIGGERSNNQSLTRSNYEELCPQLPRNSSWGPYDNRPRKEPRTVDGMKPWMRSNGIGPTQGERNSWSYCKLCRASLLSEAQYEEHLRTTKHQNKVAKFNAIPYKKYCECCKVHLNSESQAKEHFSSGRHEQTVAKSQKAPPQQHLPLITVPEEFILQPSTRTQPYDYQMELYRKAMKANGVCFLPTGTGKTLVASLVIGHMLALNPSRQVVFLVDRVLLVLQQRDYLRKELAHVRVADERGPFKGTRPIRIGAVCGEMRKLEGNARIYEQDVLIITADCYRNHLNNGTLRFDDVSLIVLDEAHHCNKDHPYNVIIRDFYLREDVLLGHRPKILGLTASPAGEISLDKTTKRLQRLLGNLGEAQLLIVTNSVQELEEKTNRAPPDCISASYTNFECELMDVLVEYVTKAFNMAVRLSEMKDYKDIFQPSSGGHFSIDDIYPVLGVIDNILLSHPESNALHSLLHFQLMCEVVCTLQECGEQIAIYQMAELADEKCPHGFYWAENVGLPCAKVRSHLEHYLWQGGLSKFHGPNSGIEQLMKQLSKINWTGTSSGVNFFVLVLVKRARTARYLASYLSNCGLLRGVKTTFFAGYGGGSADNGVTYSPQRDVYPLILEGNYQIVVTTSVAEDGFDLPVPNFVIQMDPSSSVSALVQIRGRAPLNEARFVAICRNDDQAKKIEDLLKREENMRRSARLINGL